MTGAQTSLLPPTPADERAGETDTAARGDDPTPRGIFRALLPEVFELTVDPRKNRAVTRVSTHTYPRRIGGSAHAVDVTKGPVRVLDVCAGYGGIASEARRHANRRGWPVHITGVEICEARRRHLRKWCDGTVIDDWQRWLDGSGAEYDLIVGNPAFELLTGPKGAKLPPEKCMPAVLLRHAPAVLLLHQQQAFVKSEAGRASWRHSPPAASWLLPGGLKFRGPTAINPKNGKVYGADSTCYQATLWLRDHTGPCTTYLLDDLDASDRQWLVPPGSEQPSKCKAWGCGEDCPKGQRIFQRGATGATAAWATCDSCKGSGLDPNGDLPSAPGWQP